MTEVLEDAARRKNAVRGLVTWLLTPAERGLVCRRILTAQRLARGWSYRMIEDDLRVSSRTIATLDRALKKLSPRYRPLVSLRHHPRKDPPPPRDWAAGIPLSITGIGRGLLGSKIM